MSKYARFASSPFVAADMRAEEERREQGLPAAQKKAPPVAQKLQLFDDGGIWRGPCPACRAEGRDDTGNHLFLFPTGAWGCVCFKGEAGRDHRRRMMELLPELRGKKGQGIQKRSDFRAEKEAVRGIMATDLWEEIKAELAMTLEENPFGKSAHLPGDLAGALAVYCAAFAPGQRAWAGSRWDLGEEKWNAQEEAKRHDRNRFISHIFDPHDLADRVRMVERIERDDLDHASGRILGGSETERAIEDESTLKLAFRVVEHDSELVGGVKTDTPIPAQVAAVRYAQTVLGWRLLWVISTGGKGIHAAFDTSSISCMQISTHLDLLEGVGADPNGLRRGSTRIPGALRVVRTRFQKRNPQSLLWVSPDLEIK